MPVEAVCLAAVLLLALVQILLPGWARTRQVGLDWNMGPRDEPPPPPGLLGGRLLRAQANLYETLPLFLGADLAVIALHRESLASALGALAYVLARAVYLPLYASGVVFWRSLVWIIALAGLLVLIAALVIG